MSVASRSGARRSAGCSSRWGRPTRTRPSMPPGRPASGPSTWRPGTASGWRTGASAPRSPAPRDEFVLATKVGWLLEPRHGAASPEAAVFPGAPGVRPRARLQPRRRPAFARGEPGAARARSCRHRADPRPRRPHGRSARARLSRAGRTARAGRRAGDRRRDGPGAGADAVRAGDRRRLRPRRRPLHAAGPQRRGGAAPGVPGARRGGDRRRRVQQRRAGRPVGASDVRLPHRAGAGGHARPADRRDLRGPRRPGRGRRDGLPAAPPGAIAGLAPGEQAAVLGETARAFYGLSE
jgi:hypothetical protein